MNIIWPLLFIISYFFASLMAFYFNDISYFEKLTQVIFSNTKLAIDILIGLTGLLCFWLGLFKIIEKTGFVANLALKLTPLLSFLIPSIPKGHPAFEPILMNVSANFLGLDNAATPMGLKAMQLLQTLNTKKDTLSDAQIFFIVLNTASITFFPSTVFMYRAQMGAEAPTDIFLPLLMTSFVSTFAGLLSVLMIQKINLLTFKSMCFLFGIVLFFSTPILLTHYFGQHFFIHRANFIPHLFLACLISFILIAAMIKKVQCFDEFIEGAKEGFQVALKMAPYLIAMLVAVGVLRESGLLPSLVNGVEALFHFMGFSTDFVSSLPTAIMKSFSGSGARAMMLDVMKTEGADSFAGHLVSMIQGSSETTFYVLTLYTGVIGIKKIRYALYCSLFADTVAFVSAVFFARLFF